METWHIILLVSIFIVILPVTLWFLNLTRNKTSIIGKIIHTVFVWYFVITFVLLIFFTIGGAISRYNHTVTVDAENAAYEKGYEDGYDAGYEDGLSTAYSYFD